MSQNGSKTLVFERLQGASGERHWSDLWQRSAPDFASYRGLYGHHRRIFRGEYLLLRNRFSQERYGLYQQLSGERRLMAIAIHFRCKSRELGPASSMGGLLFDPRLSTAELKSFADQLLSVTGPIERTPFNGHFSLGLSHPSETANSSGITFMCAPKSRQTEVFLNHTGRFQPCRDLRALVTKVTPELRAKTSQGSAEAEARGFTSRPLSVLHYKRDIRIYNEIANQAMTGHEGFSPLTFAEEWQIMAQGLAIFIPSWFRFLMKDNKEIGYSFAFPDYNSHLNSGDSDFVSVLKILRARVRGRFKRARLVYSGIRPQYQGQGLFKAVRHRVIQEMIDSGVESFESSYVDEGNTRSLANVGSTGGQFSHSFHVYNSI